MQLTWPPPPGQTGGGGILPGPTFTQQGQKDQNVAHEILGHHCCTHGHSYSIPCPLLIRPDWDFIRSLCFRFVNIPDHNSFTFWQLQKKAQWERGARAPPPYLLWRFSRRRTNERAPAAELGLHRANRLLSVSVEVLSDPNISALQLQKYICSLLWKCKYFDFSLNTKTYFWIFITQKFN